MKLYSVTTWDGELEEYTPQEGMSVPWEDLTIWQVRDALVELKKFGYSCHRIRDSNGDHDCNDVNVLVEWTNFMADVSNSSFT